MTQAILFTLTIFSIQSLHAKTQDVVTFDEIQEVKKGKTKVFHNTSKAEIVSENEYN